MTTPQEIREQIADAEQRLASMKQADLHRDGKDLGHDSVHRNSLLSRLSFLRARLIQVASWEDLQTDGERDLYIQRLILMQELQSRDYVLAYLSDRQRMARETGQLRETARKQHRDLISLRTQLAGLRAQIELDRMDREKKTE